MLRKLFLDWDSGSYDRDWEGGAPGLGATRRKRKAVPEVESQRRCHSQGTRVGGRRWDWVAMAASACAVGAGLAFLELVGAGGWSQLRLQDRGRGLLPHLPQGGAKGFKKGQCVIGSGIWKNSPWLLKWNRSEGEGWAVVWRTFQCVPDWVWSTNSTKGGKAEREDVGRRAGKPEDWRLRGWQGGRGATARQTQRFICLVASEIQGTAPAPLCSARPCGMTGPAQGGGSSHGSGHKAGEQLG